MPKSKVILMHLQTFNHNKKIKCYKNLMFLKVFHESKCTVKMSERISTLYNFIINCSFKNVNLNIAEFKKNSR